MVQVYSGRYRIYVIFLFTQITWIKTESTCIYRFVTRSQGMHQCSSKTHPLNQIDFGSSVPAPSRDKMWVWEMSSAPLVLSLHTKAKSRHPISSAWAVLLDYSSPTVKVLIPVLRRRKVHGGKSMLSSSWPQPYVEVVCVSSYRRINPRLIRDAVDIAVIRIHVGTSSEFTILVWLNEAYISLSNYLNVASNSNTHWSPSSSQFIDGVRYR